MTEAWLTVKRGEAPLLVSFPHTGLSVPAECASGLVSFPLARHDADYHIDRLYAPDILGRDNAGRDTADSPAAAGPVDGRWARPTAAAAGPRIGPRTD